LIIRSWTEPGPFAFAGKHYNFNYVNPWPTTYQKPHPPIWIPSQGSAETVQFAAHPDRRYTYLQTFSAATQVKRFLDSYREQADRYGYQATDDQLGWSVRVYVGDTDAKAAAEVEPHYDSFRKVFSKMPLPMLLPPGYTSVDSLMRLATRGNVTQDHPLDVAIRDGMIICGSAATVREKLEAYRHDIRFGHLIANLSFGTMPGEMTAANQTRFAEEVMAPLRAKFAATSQKSAAVAS
jgi:alkanesulfonate monooxygenase SsuD/methylene tetrahydromethanopterin reductase-like flavin-dependent oxidoreductase (luciferase family)